MSAYMQNISSARRHIGRDSGFWLLVKNEDAFPFLAAFKDSPAVFHEFLVEQRVGREIRSSTQSAQIIKIEEGPAESRVLIRPDIPVAF